MKSFIIHTLNLISLLLIFSGCVYSIQHTGHTLAKDENATSMSIDQLFQPGKTMLDYRPSFPGVSFLVQRGLGQGYEVGYHNHNFINHALMLRYQFLGKEGEYPEASLDLTTGINLPFEYKKYAYLRGGITVSPKQKKITPYLGLSYVRYSNAPRVEKVSSLGVINLGAAIRIANSHLMPEISIILPGYKKHPLLSVTIGVRIYPERLRQPKFPRYLQPVY